MPSSSQRRNSTAMMRAVKRNRSSIIALPIIVAVIVGAYFASVHLRPILVARMQASSLKKATPRDQKDITAAKMKLIGAGAAAVEPCLQLARDRSAPNASRIIAIDALVQLKSSGRADRDKIFSALAGLLSNSREEMDFRITILHLLTASPDPRLVDALSDLTDSPEADFRIEIIDSLAEVGSIRANKVLIGLLVDDDTEVRAAAASVVVRSGDRHTVSGLCELLREVNPSQASTVVRALSRLTRRDFRLQPNWHRMAYYESLRKIEYTLSDLAYLLPPDGTDSLAPALRQDVTGDLEWVAAQRAKRRIVVTLRRAGAKTADAVLPQVQTLATLWASNPGIEKTEAFDHYRRLTDANGISHVYYYVFIWPVGQSGE